MKQPFYRNKIAMLLTLMLIANVALSCYLAFNFLNLYFYYGLTLNSTMSLMWVISIVSIPILFELRKYALAKGQKMFDKKMQKLYGYDD